MGRPKKQVPVAAAVVEEDILCPDLTQPIHVPQVPLHPSDAQLADLAARVTALEAKLAAKKPQPVCVETPAAS